MLSLLFYGRRTRKPSRDCAATLLNDCEIFISRLESLPLAVQFTHVVALLHCSSSTKTQSDECWPRSTLEEEDGEDDAKAETETRFDQKRGNATIPLHVLVVSLRLYNNLEPVFGM